MIDFIQTYLWFASGEEKNKQILGRENLFMPQNSFLRGRVNNRITKSNRLVTTGDYMFLKRKLTSGTIE